MNNIVTARKEVNNMYLTVSREEVENLIREKYNLPDEVKVYINDLQSKYKCASNSIYGTAVQSSKDELLYHDTDIVSDMKVTVNNENQVQDIVSNDNPKSFRELTPQEVQETYERYAQTIEDFLKGNERFQMIELEGMTPSAMRYRYNTAIRMYGFNEQCYASATDHNGKGYAKLVRKGKVGDTK